MVVVRAVRVFSSINRSSGKGPRQAAVMAKAGGMQILGDQLQAHMSNGKE